MLFMYVNYYFRYEHFIDIVSSARETIPWDFRRLR
jgi:hypothetical protein